MKIYLLDNLWCYAGEAEVDPMGPVPLCALTPPPPTTHPQVAQFVANEWVVLEKYPEPEALSEEQEAQKARTLRNGLLAQSDWVVIRAYEQGAPIASEWAAYRQALREIPLQEGFPTDVIWPDQP